MGARLGEFPTKPHRNMIVSEIHSQDEPCLVCPVPALSLVSDLVSTLGACCVTARRAALPRDSARNSPAGPWGDGSPKPTL